MAINNKYNHITNHTQLMYTIMQVNAARAEQEVEIKHKVKEIYYSLQPAALIKKTVENIFHSPDTRKTITQSALALGTEFIIGKIFKRGTTVKGFLSSVLLGKIADYAMDGKSNFINNGVDKITNLFKQFKK